MVLSLVAIIMVTFLVPFFSGSQLLVNGAHWLQNLTILFFLVYIPRSKHLHLLFCPVNEYLRNFDRAQLRTLDFSDEQKEDFGIGQVGKFSWKDMFDSYTCIHCGRCNDACPAMVSGKSLQPREVVLGLQHAIEDQKLDQPAVDTVIDEKSLWQCTTCAACEERCPVGIEHPGKIIGVRRYRVQAETACPAEAQNIFKWLERSKNTFGIDPVEREKTISSLKIPAYEKGTQHLLWLGCFAAFDQGYRKSLGSFISILKAAGISYGVMPGEICCGDPARRLGNEFLYQEMAQSTVEHLRELDVKKVISMCPHCCVTLGRDYGDLGMNLEVTHHSVFINELISKKSISFSGVSSGSVVFHDPCYLSRYLGVVKEPGSALSAAGFSVIDPPRAGEQTFCCGGGGGQVFLEEHDGERISNLRFKELNATGAKAVAVGCPYCHTMLKDARATLGADSAMAFGDIADFVVQNMTSSSPKAS
jgi:Fe-S oxidoreductase